VPLRGVRECVVTLKVEVRAPAAYLNVAALDAQLL
jgi:hypothetical protein